MVPPSTHDSHSSDPTEGAGRDAHAHAGLAVTVERTGPCLATVRFTVSPEETARSRAQGLRNLASRTRLKGFRPGRVPPKMLEKQFGTEVDKQLLEHFCQHALQQAVRDEDLRLAANPRVDLESVEVSREAEWGHEFELLLRPEVELGEIEGLSVDARPTDVTDEELEAALADLRRQLSTTEPAGEEGLPEEGMAVCKVVYERDGDAEPLMEREGIRINAKTPPPGVDAEVFEKEMTGIKDGETRTFPLVFPDDFPTEDARGQEGRCRVEVTEAFRIVPPSDERVFETFEVADEEGLRVAVSERIGEQKQRNEEQRIEHELLERLIEAHPMELPEPLIEDQARSRVAEMRESLESQGLAESDVEARLAEEFSRSLESTRRGMRAMYLMEEIARQKDLQVTEQDLREEFASIAQRNGVDVEQVRNYYREEHLVQQLALELLERKVRRFLRESAEINQVSSAD